MKNQYACDIGDYGKFGLLRFFAKQGIRIGVNWYLTADDGSKDGKFTDYLYKGNLRYTDPELFDSLKELIAWDMRSVESIEKKRLIQGAKYYSELLSASDNTPYAREIVRNTWFNNSDLLLRNVELVFLDPDNGLSTTKTPGSKGSEKYVLPEEIVRYYVTGRNVVYYCHKGRRNIDEWQKYKSVMKDYIADAQIIVLTYHKGTQRSFVFIVHPDDYKRYRKTVSGFLKTEWADLFTLE